MAHHLRTFWPNPFVPAAYHYQPPFHSLFHYTPTQTSLPPLPPFYSGPLYLVPPSDAQPCYVYQTTLPCFNTTTVPSSPIAPPRPTAVHDLVRCPLHPAEHSPEPPPLITLAESPSSSDTDPFPPTSTPLFFSTRAETPAAVISPPAHTLQESTLLPHIDTPPLEVIDLGERQPVRIAANLPDTFKQDVLSLLQQYKSIFAWNYSDLRGIKTELGQLSIPTKPDFKPVYQRQYRLNPNYRPRVQEELAKLLKAGLIYEVHHSDWVSPIVVVLKKNGKIRVCVDYRKLNEATDRDHFPLPFTDQVLEDVAGHEMYSFMDGFSGYNQISIRQEDQLKTTFTTPWGTFLYRVVPFGLSNSTAHATPTNASPIPPGTSLIINPLHPP